MKKSLFLVLSLVMVAAFAVGCSSDDNSVTEATMAPIMEATAEATVEAPAATAEATMEAPDDVEATDDSTVTEEATAETIPDETENTGDNN